MVRQGQDLPIATMGGGAGTHALANSKGVRIDHMLRGIVGDEVFFEVLRNIVLEFNGQGNLTADALRTRFVAAAPAVDLSLFFTQWLDRTGAPIFDVDWHANVDGTGMLLKLEQMQDGEPFRLDLEIEVALVDGGTEMRSVTVDSKTEFFEIETGDRPTGVRLRIVENPEMLQVALRIQLTLPNQWLGGYESCAAKH